MTRSSASRDCLGAAARLHLETSRLLGVDFIPVRRAEQTWKDRPAADAAHASPPEPGAAANCAGDGLNSKHARLAQLRALHDRDCRHCTSAAGIRNMVFGEGSPDAAIMFIGEAPGEEEDRTGRPFVGRAGQKLDEIIKAMGLSRQQVYIANVLKARPPNNRTPLQHEVEACAPFLTEQIRIIQPRVIVALGGPAAKMLLRSEAGITRLRGQWGWYENADVRVPLMPTFHPAYLLRNYTVQTRQQVWSDMQAVMARLAGRDDG